MTIRIINVITRMIVGGPQQVTLLSGAYYRERRGFEYQVVCGGETGAEGDYHGELTDQGILWRKLSPLVRELAPKQDLQALAGLVALFRRVRPSIVHARSAKARLLAPLAARLAGVPVVVQTVHGWSFNNAVDARKPLFVGLEKLSQALCHCSVFVSNPDYEEGLKLGIVRSGALEQGRAAIIRSGVDFESAHPISTIERERLRSDLGVEPGTRVVSLIQRLSEPKTPLVFVDAIRRLAPRYPNMVAWIIGDGNLRKPTEAAVSEAGLGPQFQFLGLRRDIPALISASDLVVHSSIREGLPRVVLETLHLGTPLIATSVGGVPEVLRDGENGLLVPPSDPAALATAIAAVLDDPTSARTRADRGYTAVQPFSAKRMLDDQHALYLRLLGSRVAVAS